jgi:signal transduction histidine kinase/DNA-binding response OmpR family regulator
MSIVEFRSVAAGLLISLASVSAATAQTARVQFIHASPYAEVQTVDVYRNGSLWLDDFAYQGATPFTDWPEGERFRLDFVLAEAEDNSKPFYSEVLTLRPGERYYIVAAGDPLDKPGQPAFEFVLYAGALERCPIDVPPMVSFQALTVSPDAPPHTIFIRGWSSPETGGERLEEIPYMGYGDILDEYDMSPPFQFEVDQRTPDGRIVSSVIANRLGLGGNAVIVVTSGFINPPRSGDAPFNRGMEVLPDGRVRFAPRNLSRVQFIHNSPYEGVDSVDISVTRLDNWGPDEVVLHLDNLGFREASPFFDLPSGLAISGEQITAPVLVIDITSTDGVDTLLTKRLRLQTGQTHVMVLAGDPLRRADQQPMDLFVSDQGREMAGDSGMTDLSIFNGAGDIITVAVGYQTGGVPIAAAVPFGSFTPYIPLEPRNDSLYLADAESRDVLTFFQTSLDKLADSALVVLVSGFYRRPEGIAAANSGLVLVAARPSGGPLFPLKQENPPPWWQQPFYYLIGLVGLAVVVALGSQLRLRRLEAHAKELNTLVDERTRELRLEKEKTEEQARRLTELDEAKNRFFANISHEFRTPLTLVLGPLQDAIEGAYGAVSPHLNRQHRLMRRNARRLLRLVNQLLDLSKLESGKMDLHPRPGELIGFLQELVRVFTPLAERRRVTLEFSSDVNTVLTNFDADAIEKVFANLISNALKFTPEGGRVVVEASLVDEGDSRQVRVEVRDNGTGIPEEHLERIFERFQQADTSIRRSHEGTGIGLTLAKELAELHGGTLTAESVIGEGSAFTVILPVEDFVGEPEPDLREVESVMLEEPMMHPTGDGLPSEVIEAREDAPVVLVVEDNADVREYLRSHLETRYRLIEAEDGEAGLEAAQKYKPDLILSDVMMPKMDGYEMCRSIKASEELSHIPIIMLTAKAAERDTLEGLGSGADDYIAKPFSVSELQARIANFISSHSALRDKFSREVIVKPGDIEITPDEETFLSSLLEVVSDHLSDSTFSVDWLADEVGLSRRQVERKVHAVTGQSPADLIRSLRLERASQLLRANAGPVSEIAYSVGFKSPAHFASAFKKRYGDAPSEHAEADSPTST